MFANSNRSNTINAQKKNANQIDANCEVVSFICQLCIFLTNAFTALRYSSWKKLRHLNIIIVTESLHFLYTFKDCLSFLDYIGKHYFIYILNLQLDYGVYIGSSKDGPQPSKICTSTSPLYVKAGSSKLLLMNRLWKK